MTVNVTLRATKGAALTHAEMDNNFSGLKQEFDILAESNSTVPVGGKTASFLALNATRYAQDRVVSAKDFSGVLGDGSDQTTGLTNFINYVKDNAPMTALIPAGIYKFSTLPDMAKSGVTWLGQGFDVTIFEYTGSGTALTLNAFASGSPSAPFVNGCNLKGIRVKGTSSMTIGILAQGIARSYWDEIKVTGGSVANESSVAFDFRSVNLSSFRGLVSSYEDSGGVSTLLPYRGLFLQAGSRAGSSLGGCSNNTFITPHLEGMKIGIQIASNGGDQNTFIGGSAESLTRNGIIIGVNCRYNTLIGVGFENLDATQFDIEDNGFGTRYINVYSSHKTLINGEGIKVEGSFFERLEFSSSAKNCSVEDVVVKNWSTPNGGFFNSSAGLRWANIKDADTGTYLRPESQRAGLTVGTSPFVYKNNTGVTAKILVREGTITQVLMLRGTDSWIEANPTAAAGATNVGVYTIEPLDEISVSFSAAPVIQVIPQGGIG